MAAFLDGEGCIGLGCRNNPAKCRPYRWVIFGHIDNSCEKAIMHIYNVLQKLVPVGKTRGKGYIQNTSRHYNNKPMWRVTVSSRLLKALLLEIGDYLIVKKRQAELILEAIPILASNKGRWTAKNRTERLNLLIANDKRLREIYWEIRDLNKGAKLKSSKRLETISEKTMTEFLEQQADLCIDFLKCESR
jgi:hypothetical protein